MRKIILFVLLFLTIAAFSSPVTAGSSNAKGSTEEGVCDVLKEDGVTKGLYGLCVAYCEAEASSERVLENYNRKATENDPAMPCLETAVSCPCWSMQELEGAIAFTPQFCVQNDSSQDVSLYGNNEVFFVVDFGDPEALSCFYGHAVDGVVEVQGMSPEQAEDCRTSLRAQQAVDFESCQ